MKDLRIVIIMATLCTMLGMCGLELASVATALPTILHNLSGSISFAWVSAAYTLSSTAILPLSGRLAEIFGRRPTLLAAIVFFAAGSAIAGSAPNVTALVAGRAVQGIGSGGIQSLSQIVVADLIPLRKRGIYTSVTGLAFSVSTLAGPFIGGALTSGHRSNWRWLFYLNLPLSGLCLILVQFFMPLKHQKQHTKLSRLDIGGNILIIGSSTICVIALTWAGVRFNWTSVQVLVPLILGISGLLLTVVYELLVASDPVIPLRVISNRTTLIAYLMSFIHGIILINGSFYLPVYFQAVKLASPLASGLYLLPTVLSISPLAILQGLIVAHSGKYWLLIVTGWTSLLIGSGLLSILDGRLSVAVSIPFQLISSVGWGFLYATTFPVLAPLDVSLNASALSLLVFARTFSQSWGVAIGATILQNRLQQGLPKELLSEFPTGTDIAYSIIPLIPGFPPSLKHQAQEAFIDGLKDIWRVMIAFSGIGLILVAIMKELPLQTHTDKNCGLKERKTDEEGNGWSVEIECSEVALSGRQGVEPSRECNITETS